MSRPRVLMVIGAYYPEMSGGGLQCRELIRGLKGRVTSQVLTTCTDASLPRSEEIEGVQVHRIPIDVRSRRSRIRAGWRLWRVFRALADQVDIVHVHGVTQKNIPITWLARRFHKRLLLTLHTAGNDDPQTVRRRGRLAFRSYLSADRVVAVSPSFKTLFEDAGLPTDKLRVVPNGIDTERFQAVTASRRAAIRRAIGIPEDERMILAVGFFSRDKGQEVLCDAWVRCGKDDGPAVHLVLVGARRSAYHEIDPQLEGIIRDKARRAGLGDRLHFVEPTPSIERYYQAADLFVLPSMREALPVALLEAMACGLPCVASRLMGSTESMIEDGVDGRLVPVGEASALAAAIEELLQSPERAATLGAAARQRVTSRFAIEATATRYAELYEELAGRT